MNIKPKILFVCPSFSSFIQNDLDMLRRFFDVKVVQYKGKRRLLKFVIETLKGVLWSDLTFSWFADVHALNKQNYYICNTLKSKQNQK
ncbi:hypothetical protein KAW18_17700 [candidate division WOR-3 bacterium]|nr:hypothetical protein [candidate division WOR-3 bacterium]